MLNKVAAVIRENAHELAMSKCSSTERLISTRSACHGAADSTTTAPLAPGPEGYAHTMERDGSYFRREPSASRRSSSWNFPIIMTA
jgi:hypothetical protein